MAVFAWVMMGLALWHFTIFIPDRFLGGIVGAFVAAIVGSVVFGLIISGFTIPGQDDTTIVSALEAIPGTLIGLAVCWYVGMRRGNEPLVH
jgi:membrane protease YdiL (CAAX protease family)